MKSTDTVWIIDDDAVASQVQLSRHLDSGSPFPFFDTELEANLDAQVRFASVAGEKGLAAVDCVAKINRAGSRMMLQPVVSIAVDGTSQGDISGGLNYLPAGVGPVAAGNAVLAIVSWDGAGTLDSVKLNNGDDASQTDMTLIETVTVGGTSGRKLALYLITNLPAISVAGVGANWSGSPERATISAATVSQCAASPLDISLTASGSDNVPTTAASGVTAAVNEAFIAVLLVAGSYMSPSDFPLDPDGFVQQPLAFNQFADAGHLGTWFTVFVWTMNVSAIGNYGFATTLPAAADWAAAMHSFKGGPLS